MKNCIFMVVIASVALNTLASEKKPSVSDSRLIIPHQKPLRNSATHSFSISEQKAIIRSPKVEMRLECFNDHANSNHDLSFIQKVLASDDGRYPIYVELIKSCITCNRVFQENLKKTNN